MKPGRKKNKAPGPCPCFSGHTYRRCCGPLHDGEPAATPEALMRSRYAAYALGDADYIMATTHPGGPHHQTDADAWRGDVRAFCKATRFTGLEILEAHDDVVVFRAGLKQRGEDASFVERSTFARDDGRWKYLEGEPG